MAGVNGLTALERTAARLTVIKPSKGRRLAEGAVGEPWSRVGVVPNLAPTRMASMAIGQGAFHAI